MRVWVMSLMHNEARMLPYFLRHYLQVAERVIIFDDHSDDGGMDLALAAGAEVRPYPGQGLDDLAFVEFAAATYPEARGQADWVIWVDADEFIYHSDLRGRLAFYSAAGVELPLVKGYAMYAPAFPTSSGQIYEEVKTGVPYSAYDKPCVLDPRINVTWHAGKHGLLTGHEARRSQAAELKLLHYRHLGQTWFEGRNHRNHARMSPANIERQHGYQVYDEHRHLYGWQPQQAGFAGLMEVI